MFALFLAIANNQYEDEMNNRKRIRLIKKTLRDSSDPFQLDAEYFRQHYRLTPALAVQLINVLKGHALIQRQSAIPYHLQVLSVLRLLAEGSFQKGAAADFNHPLSQASMSRCLDHVLDDILSLKDQLIVFPRTAEERQQKSNNFRRFIRIPNIIGLIDCFLVACRRPTENEEAFFNYKAGPSLNVQMVTDANNIIMNLCICPGSNTDRFIWNISDLKVYLEALRNNADIVVEEGPYYLLGDSGYTPSMILLTPIVNAPEGSAEARYTNEHVSTRCKIEQTFGILSNTWMVINRARKLYYQPQKISRIITACAILHNFCKLNGMVVDDHVVHADVVENVEDPNYDYLAGIAERQNLIRRYYL